MKIYLYFFLFSVIALFAGSCSNNSDNEKAPAQPSPITKVGTYNIDSIVEKNNVSLPFDFVWKFEGQNYNFCNEIKGKVVLVNFWKTTCLECIEELPYLKQIAKEYSDKDFLMVGLNCDMNYNGGDKSCYDSVAVWVKDSAINYINFYSYIYPAKYRIKLLPSSIVINKEGVTVDTIYGPRSYQEYKDIIDSYLK